MMKKYNKPEIVALALEMVDVIETSAVDYAAAVLANTGGVTSDKIRKIETQVTQMNDDWGW